MKTPIAARFSMATLLAGLLYALTIMRPGLRIVGVSFPRQVWLAENPAIWALGLWLWLAAFFCWMWVIVSLMWEYLPAHRISSMLQSGLLIISATLAISGIVVWMAALPAVLPLQSVSELLLVIDNLAFGLLGAGALMGGVVTSWVAVDLMRYSPLHRGWLAMAAITGALAVPSPFVLPFPWHLVAAALFWLIWVVYLGRMHRLPSAYPEMR